MNIVNILEEIEKVDGDIYERISPRRKAMKEFFGLGSKVAAAAMPFALGSIFNKAYGQTVPPAVIQVLQYALTLEHFEAAFYVQGFNAAGLIPTADRAAIQIIRDSETKHVDFLKKVLTSIMQTPVAAKASYDFTAGTGTSAGAGNGPFKPVFTDYATFLAVAQVLEDTGVRAYKGRAGELVGQPVFLTAALGIHAVEARHAAKIRYMRRMNASSAIPGLKPWITGANDSGVAAAAGNYGGATPESNVNQASVIITDLNGVGGKISMNAATEAFDEPLTATEVLALVSAFGVS
jgi:hypothetical protein